MIIDFTDAHKNAFLKLNETYVHWLSPLDRRGLDYILEKADYKKCYADPSSGRLLGAVIAYSHDIDYPDHENIIWLRQRYENFFYIDRIVIAGKAQGQGIGHSLYQDLERHARCQNHARLACEVNTVPDNPASHAFHLREGFQPLGEQIFANGSKAVRYYVKALN